MHGQVIGPEAVKYLENSELPAYENADAMSEVLHGRSLDDGLVSADRFRAALAAVEREYVEDLPSDRLVYSSIDGLLKTLDQITISSPMRERWTPRMASASPYTTCAVGRPRRSVSLSIAGRSSCTSE